MGKRDLGVFILVLGLIPAMAAAEETKTVAWSGSTDMVAEAAFMFERGAYQEGIEVTREALRGELLDRDRAAALANLCMAELALRLVRDAIGHCTSALDIRPSLWQGYNNRAKAHDLLGNYDLAIGDYNRALVLRPGHYVLERNLRLAIDRKARNAGPMVQEWES